MDTKTTIPLFEANQILSSTHLNQLREYLDNEIRYSRTKLSGVGIVCGLNLVKEPTTSEIVINTGYGITTDGFLLELVNPSGADPMIYKYYLPYTDPMVHPYDFGKDKTWDSNWDESGDPPQNTEVKSEKKKAAAKAKGNSGSSAKPVVDTTVYPEIFELFTEETTEYNIKANPLSGFATDAKIKVKFDDMSIVLVAEIDDVDLKSCTGTNCDNKGKRREVTLRMLLVPTKELAKYDTLDLLKVPDALSFLNIPRLSGTNLAGITDMVKLKIAYQTNIIDKHAPELKSKIELAYEKYHYLLALTDKNLNQKNNLVSITSDYVQYSADLFSDITQTFNEFANEAYLFFRSCGSTIADPFPRHLTIGQIKPGSVKDYDMYRTVFFNVPPFDAQDHHLQAARMLFEKMLLLIADFKDESKQAHTVTDIKITPDVSTQQLFSEKSIPVYYDQSKLTNLILYWNPEKTMRGREKERYAYYSNKYAISDLFRKPFEYSLNQMSMLRVEGIAGLNALEAKEKLKQLKKDNNLNFDIKLLKLEAAAPVIDTGYDCGMDDLQADYLLVRNEMICCIKEFLEILDLNDDPFRTKKRKKKTGIFEDLIKEIRHSFPKEEHKSEDFILSAPTFIQLGEIVAKMNSYADPVAEDAIKLLPYSFLEFDYREFLNSYKLLEFLAVQYRTYYEIFLEMIERIYADIELKTGKGRELNRYRDIINRLRWLDCNCIYPKLGILVTLRDRRIAVNKAAAIFSNYVSAHPGLEHFAGVPQNGTLFLVYSTTKLFNGGPANQIVADFAMQGTCCDNFCTAESFERIDQPLIPMDNEEVIFADELDSLGDTGLIIDVLNNDYYAGKPLKNLEEILIDPVKISIPPDDKYHFENLGIIEVGEDGKRPVIIYRQKEKVGATIDFFLLKIIDKKTETVDYCTVRVIVKEPASGFINTKPDKAATVVGKTVRINLLVNDNSDFDRKTLTVYLAHEFGGPSSDDPFLTELGNEVMIKKEEDGFYYAIFNAENTSNKIKDTITDRFYYIVKDDSKPENFSVTTMVEVDIIPCCEGKTVFTLPKLEFCKNEKPVDFTVEVPDVDMKAIVVRGPGVTYDKGKDIWKFNPASEEVDTTDISFTLLDKITKQVFGTIHAKVHPIAKLTYTSAVSIATGSGIYIVVSCLCELQEAKSVEWYINDELITGQTMEGLQYTMRSSLKIVTLKLRAFYDREFDPACFHEIVTNIDVVPYDTQRAMIASDTIIARNENDISVSKDDKVKDAIKLTDAVLPDDTIKMSNEISRVLLDKREWVKLKTSEREKLLVDSSEVLNRLNTAATKVTGPGTEVKDSVYSVYKNNAFSTLSLAVASVGTSTPSVSVNTVLAKIGEQFSAVKIAGQFTASDKAQMTEIINQSKDNAALTKKLIELKNKM